MLCSDVQRSSLVADTLVDTRATGQKIPHAADVASFARSSEWREPAVAHDIN